MTKEIELFLDNTFLGAKPSKELANLSKAAATIQFWREDGVELPAGLRAADVMEYAIKANREREKPALKVYKINVSENHYATIWVEAHDEDEAESIFQSYCETADGLEEITDRLTNGTEGFECDCAVLDEDRWRPDVPYTEGKKLLD